MSNTTDVARATDPKARLQLGLQELGMHLGRAAQAKLLTFADLLQKWNRTYNLTGIREAGSIVSGHLLDSLSIAPYVEAKSMLDVGSGAGFPGIPLAISAPNMRVTLLDSNQKKAAFLRQAVSDLDLSNASVVCERVESWQPQEKFDVIVSRAVTGLGEFIRLSRHLLAPDGRFAAMKGALSQQELADLPQGFRVRETRRIQVPGLDAERNLVLMERA